LPRCPGCPDATVLIAMVRLEKQIETRNRRAGRAPCALIVDGFPRAGVCVAKTMLEQSGEVGGGTHADEFLRAALMARARRGATADMYGARILTETGGAGLVPRPAVLFSMHNEGLQPPCAAHGIVAGDDEFRARGADLDRFRAGGPARPVHLRTRPLETVSGFGLGLGGSDGSWVGQVGSGWVQTGRVPSW